MCKLRSLIGNFTYFWCILVNKFSWIDKIDFCICKTVLCYTKWSQRTNFCFLLEIHEELEGRESATSLPSIQFWDIHLLEKLRWQTCQNILFCLLGHIFFCLLCTFVSFSNYIFLHREILLDCTSPFIMQNLLKLVVNVLKLCRT